MADFMMLIKGGDIQARKLSPEEMDRHMQKWGAWMKNLAERGHFKAGEPLGKGGKIVRGVDRVVMDGPFPEAKDLVGGYIMVQAKDLEEATRLARECPLFEEGQNLDAANEPSVEVRPIQKMDL